MSAPPRLTPLAEKLIARIAKAGPITFADYMDACLYDPEFGYYASPDRAKGADYFTSVELHSSFGKLIARQLDEMWRVLDRPEPFVAAELGAGNGLLAKQILDFTAANLPEFHHVFHYIAIERSAARRAAQSQLLSAHFDSGRAESRDSLPPIIALGCVLSNEFFDALPTHRVVVRHGRLQEVLVGFDGTKFVEELRALSTRSIEGYFAQSGVELRESQQAEACLAAVDAIRGIGVSLGRGFVLTVDYGHDARELFNERHMRGTMLAYRGRETNENFYEAPGEQDLTAHVNFTALELAGRETGLETLGRVSQTQFLLSLARANNFADLHDQSSDAVGNVKSRLKFKTLIHPEGMGETFQVQIQQKGITNAKLTGLAPL